MNYIRVIINYLVLAAILVAIIAVVRLAPRYGNSTVAPHDYRDMRDIPRYAQVAFDATVGINEYRIGDKVAISLGDDPTRTTYFGWVGGRPGDQVGLQDRQVMVNGEPLNDLVAPQRTRDGGTIANYPRGLEAVPPIVVPVGHLLVISDSHRFDSVEHGLFPETMVLGRITSVGGG
ncbi:MAG: hypothetical protein EA401_09285 [Planctomycetota bacterium]|nr:MAG: hypothetical protein EA401_09285 [Planctomycetota bacterium]